VVVTLFSSPVFLPLLSKILPLYLMIAAGFIAGRYLGVSRRTVSTLVIYMVAPVTFFGFIARADLTPAAAPMVLVTFAMGTICGLIVYGAGGLLFKDATRNLAAMGGCTGNTGYFGVPVFLALFPAEQLGVYMLAMVGISVCEATVGYYLLARGKHDWRQSLRRLIRLPLLYAATAGLVVNLLGVPGHPILLENLERVKGAYVVLGMMMVGFGLAGVKLLALDWKFIGLMVGQKLLLWPLVAFGLLALDDITLQILDPLSRNCLLLLAAVPLAANMVAFATQLRVYPEKAATAVLISSLLGLITVPLFAGQFLQ
jgi:hypothetical protein